MRRSCYIGATVVWCYSQHGASSHRPQPSTPTMRAMGPVGSALHSASHVETVFLGGWRSNEADTTTTISAGPDYVPLSLARLLDTRMGATTVDGIAAATEALAPGEVRVLPVINRGGLPNDTIDAVVLNIAAVMPTSPGYLTVWPGDGAVPGVGNSQPQHRPDAVDDGRLRRSMSPGMCRFTTEAPHRWT